MTMTINREPEFHVELATALDNRDEEAIQRIRKIVSDWMETDEEHEARMNLIDIVEGAINTLVISTM